MMLRLGSDVDHAREMDLDDILRGRIDLLLLMARDFFEGRLKGDRRLKVLVQNALHVELECASLVEVIDTDPIDNHAYLTLDFCQCLKRLAGMMRSVAMGDTADDARRKAIKDYADAIAEALEEDDQAANVLIEDCLDLLLMRLMVVF